MVVPRLATLVSTDTSVWLVPFFGYFGLRKSFWIEPNKSLIRFGSESVASVYGFGCRSFGNGVTLSMKNESEPNFIKRNREEEKWKENSYTY